MRLTESERVFSWRLLFRGGGQGRVFRGSLFFLSEGCGLHPGGRSRAVRGVSKRKVEHGVGLSRRIDPLSRDDVKTHPGVETRGPGVLFVDVDAPDAAMPDGVLRQLPSQPLAEVLRSDEKHLDPVARDAGEGGENPSAADHEQFDAPERFVAHDAAVESDVFPSEKIVGRPHGRFPKRREGVQLAGRRVRKPFDRVHSRVTGSFRRAKLRARAAAKGVEKVRAPVGHPFTQAQQRRHRAGSVRRNSPAGIACVGQSAAKRPQSMHRAASPAGRSTSGCFFCRRR